MTPEEIIAILRTNYQTYMTEQQDDDTDRLEEYGDHFDKAIRAIVAAAEQRGAARAFRRTQEIIAGFDHTIDEARNRDDMINTGYLIQEIDTEIQDLMEDDDAG